MIIKINVNAKNFKCAWCGKVFEKENNTVFVRNVTLP